MRDAHRLSAADAAQVRALYADISRPPPTWERVAVVLGYAVGGVTLVVLALGAIIGAVGGLVVADKLDAGDTVMKAFAAIGAVLVGFVSVPFVGEWVIGFVVHFDADAAMGVVTSAKAFLSGDLTVAAVLYFLGVVPTALAWRTSQSISGLEELQAKLAAQPATTAKGASCRRCGAPLDVEPGALGTRCLYCGADNLLQVPRDVAAKKKADATAIDAQVQAAAAAYDDTKRADRATMWLLLGAGLLLAPLLCVAGWVLHAILGA